MSAASSAMPWSLWLNQTAAIVRLDLRKNFFNRRLWFVYLGILAPVAITGIHSMVSASGTWGIHSMGEDMRVFAGIFYVFYLRLALFFGCAWIFSTLYRGEMLDKTMHYYMLCAVRREVLLVGKYLAGVITASAILGGSVAASFYLIGAHYGAAYSEFLRGQGASYLFWYLAAAALGCVGYGAIFLLAGLYVKNPMISAAFLLVWEGLNPFLPALFQKISVIYYLKSLMPLEVPYDGPLQLLVQAVQPATWWEAIFGVLLVSAAGLVLAAIQSRKMELNYTE